MTEDPADVGLRAEASADPVEARRVLFCGDPASLPQGLAARCAVVTMAPVAASDLTVLVARRAATLHPMGVVVRPHLQSTETAEQIDELVAPHPDGDHTPGSTSLHATAVSGDGTAVGHRGLRADVPAAASAAANPEPLPGAAVLGLMEATSNDGADDWPNSAVANRTAKPNRSAFIVG